MREVDILWACVLMIVILTLIGFAGASAVVLVIDLIRGWSR